MRINGVIVKKTKKKGLGVFANRNFNADEIVVIGKMTKRLKRRTKHSFQIDFDTHVDLDEPARLINHSCEPNSGVKNNSYDGYDFVALQKIQKGEEITWDYETTEYISIAVGKCLCGSKNCRGRTRGFKYLPKEAVKGYNGFIADYLKGYDV